MLICVERCYLMCFLSVMAAGCRGGVVARHEVTGLDTGSVDVGTVGGVEDGGDSRWLRGLDDKRRGSFPEGAGGANW